MNLRFDKMVDITYLPTIITTQHNIFLKTTETEHHEKWLHNLICICFAAYHICNNVECGPNAHCVKGKCVCNVGYMGPPLKGCISKHYSYQIIGILFFMSWNCNYKHQSKFLFKSWKSEIKFFEIEILISVKRLFTHV